VFSFDPQRCSSRARRVARSASVAALPVHTPGRKFASEIESAIPSELDGSISEFAPSPIAASATPQVHPMMPPPRSSDETSGSGVFARSFATATRSISIAPAQSRATSSPPPPNRFHAMANPAFDHRSHAASRSVTATTTRSMHVMGTTQTTARLGQCESLPGLRIAARALFSRDCGVSGPAG
jgi:hypothetical protein